MKFIYTLPFLFLSISASAQSAEGKPKLIVGIVVDQMRSELLLRYDDLYGDGGFKRLRREGFYAGNNHFSYMPTTTGPGHASVYTGTTPAVHGIAGNNWYDPTTKEKVYCAEDRSVRTIGAQNADGQMSPKNLKTTTITDELRMFWNFRSKVVGVSVKDRGSILPAGHLANAAYWLSDGNFITSSFYMEALPKWVNDFNAKGMAQKYIDGGWTTLLPIEKYMSSLPDDNPYETVMADENAAVFPRDLKKLAPANGNLDLVKVTPFGNSICFEMATAAIAAEGLGEDAITDFLALSLSSTDYMGHAYGPRSIEVQDTYLRLDADLEKFLKLLDAKVGKGNYTVFLTADHGAAEVSQYNIDRKLPGGYIDTDNAKKYFKSILEEISPLGMELIEEIEGNTIFFDRAKIAEADLELDDLCEEVARRFTMFPGVYAAYPAEQILWGAASEFPMSNLKRGLYPKLAGDVVWVINSGWLDYGPTGTSHGTPWTYDSHVPLLFFGAGVKAGKTFRETHIRDIAPTLSMMFGIPLPSGATGHPVVEAILE